ncbi:MAG: aspartate dehydrogenase domain-containing protein [Pseudomonadota bacterium]
MLGRQDLIDLAEGTGAKIVIPPGGMLGLDAIKAVAVGHIDSVVVETRKPVAGLIKAPYVAQMDIDLATLTEPSLILEVSVTEVARAFPANVNVAAAVSLAGLDPDRTRMEVWANPATGRITTLSVVAFLRQKSAVVWVGT